MKRPGVGVAIGRFQVHALHAGHLALINKANEHHKLVVLICVSPHLGTPSDPLDYAAREQMVREAFPGAMTAPLHDNPTDKGWSDALDTWLGNTCPMDAATVYFGRASSIANYSGGFTTSVVDEVPHVSGTDIRALVGKTVLGAEAFRAGVIYMAHNQWPRATAVVDIALTRPVATGGYEVLVGTRANERGAVRFPGGHVNISDNGAEMAARRELQEETGLEAGAMRIVGNYRVRGWKNSPGYALFTTLFHAEYTFGAPVAGDDLDGVRWVSPADGRLTFADDHAMLAQKLVAYLERTKP